MTRRLQLIDTEDGWEISEVHVFDHPGARVCPGCQQDVSRIAVVKCAYTYRPCGCERADYEHLVEQLWHLDCLRDEADR